MEANNAAAMLETLTDISRGLETKMKDRPASVTAHEMAIYRRCKDALAAPARNCDLPNPEERYLEFCSRYLSCSYCPHNSNSQGELRCTGKWLLAPAEKGGAE